MTYIQLARYCNDEIAGLEGEFGFLTESNLNKSTKAAPFEWTYIIPNRKN